ncbi:MAG: tRNA guanosine(15) transglycosylase TgtA [Thermoplasmatota archaeon]
MNDERSSFEIRDCDLAGRCGILTVNGRKVKTPALMPVINPNTLRGEYAITPSELKSVFSFQMIITNSYIIRKSPKLMETALEKGLHSMLDFDGVIMTDSGTFQSYIYGSSRGEEVDVDPLEIVKFQRDIGSDIGTILDRFTVPKSSHEDAENDLEITLQRGRRSFDVRGSMELAVPVQGGIHADLRERSGRMVRELGCSYSPIGGVVPLLESYRYADLVDIITAAKKGLGPSIPAHLFGAGHPMIMPLAAALGSDLFDSASYAKFALDGRYMTEGRTRHLKEMDLFPCSCRVCSKFDPSDLKEMEADERTYHLSRHNLWALRSTMNEIRMSITEGTLWELVERSAANNPALYGAVKRLRDHVDYLEENAPRSTRRFMCATDLSMARPEFVRFGRQMRERYRIPAAAGTAIHRDWSNANSPPVNQKMRQFMRSGVWPVIATPLGPAPFDIIDMYPVSQSVFSDPNGLPAEIQRNLEEGLEWIRRNGPGPIIESSDEPVREIKAAEIDPDLLKTANLLRMQFGLYGDSGADVLLLGKFDSTDDLADRIRLVKSKNTGKVRNVYLTEGDHEVHILSLRAEDGLFTIRIPGAVLLHSRSGGLWWRVVVEEETAEFNARGLNVFNKFVHDADPRIRAGDEVMVVSPDGKLQAVGKAVVSSRAMIESVSGIAVKVREGIEKMKSR